MNENLSNDEIKQLKALLHERQRKQATSSLNTFILSTTLVSASASTFGTFVSLKNSNFYFPTLVLIIILIGSSSAQNRFILDSTDREDFASFASMGKALLFSLPMLIFGIISLTFNTHSQFAQLYDCALLGSSCFGFGYLFFQLWVHFIVKDSRS
ncbi:hypothetical protein [Furfurilactobacillus entadae]|uniref:hypothetical protein n=1 Tax=Furfurilactobacillus entadae TaxID=2922307 RepID=UPI0038B3B853